jgi:hypothetical protein
MPLCPFSEGIWSSFPPGQQTIIAALGLAVSRWLAACCLPGGSGECLLWLLWLY